MEYKEVEIHWLGHSGFRIEFGGKNYYFDPFQISSTLKKADFVFISHSHYDHCSLEDLQKVCKNGTIFVMPADCQSKVNRLDFQFEARIISPENEINLDGIDVKAVKSYNLGKPFHTKEEEWNGYIADFNGIKIYHAGDSDFIPEMKNLGEIDIAFLPVSGNTTMNFSEAVKAAMVIKPKIAIPMHYNSIMGSKEDALKFKELCEQEGIKVQILDKE